GATLASLIAMILGFRALAMAAAVLYALAAFLLGRAASRANAGITP
ncbi:MAG: hypothetical protein QOD06_2043, partial [Candidatus Binatota bacterium]|nr:hypothetical protein [Candidatus Binatota bacterium]